MKKYKLKNNESIIGIFLISILFLMLFIELFWSNPSIEVIVKAILLLLSITIGLQIVMGFRVEYKYQNEIKILKKKLNRVNNELQKLDNAKSEFISIASHQLRTPLTATKGYTSLVLEGTYGDISDKVRSALNKVYIANERLIQLVEDLLNISRIESGKMKYNFRNINICDVVHSLKNIFVLMAKKKNIEFKLDICTKNINVFIDSLKIREVISNLIDNAIKYTEKGFVHVKIEENNNLVRIIIEDSGMGISKNNQSHLFTKFSRGRVSARVYMEGVGLGLFIGKNIAEAHNGSIIVKSEGIGKGSCFILELPIIK